MALFSTRFFGTWFSMAGRPYTERVLSGLGLGSGLTRVRLNSRQCTPQRPQYAGIYWLLVPICRLMLGFAPDIQVCRGQILGSLRRKGPICRYILAFGALYTGIFWLFAPISRHIEIELSAMYTAKAQYAGLYRLLAPISRNILPLLTPISRYIKPTLAPESGAK